MSEFVGILSGRHTVESVIENIRALGLNAFPLPERGSSWACLGQPRNYDATMRIDTDETHFTFRERLAHPHTVVQIQHTLGNAELVTALVARYGGWIREAGQAPVPVPADADVDNPLYDFVIDLASSLPEHEYVLQRQLSRLAGEDSSALLRVQEAIGRYFARVEAPNDDASPNVPMPMG